MANKKKMKMKKSHLSMTFAFPLSSSYWFAQQKFLNIALTTYFFGNFISFLQNRGWDSQGIENYVYSSKNLYNIWLFLCVPVGAFWSFLNVFAAAGHGMAFCKSIQNLHFYDQIKQKTIGSILPSSGNKKTMGTFQTK